MALTKLPKETFIPGIQPRQGRPEYTTCVNPPSPPGSGQGSWQMVCTPVDFPEGGSISIPPGAQVSYRYDENGNVVSVSICRSEWVPYGG